METGKSMPPTRPRVLVVGDAIVPTGFTRVIESIVTRLLPAYEVHHLGVNYAGDPHDRPWPIYPAGLGGDHFGFARLPRLIEQLQPALVFIVADLWVAMKHAEALAPFRDRLRSVVYTPVESGPIVPAAMAPLLRHVDRLVAFTHYAAGEMAMAGGYARCAAPELPASDIAIIGHGVDTQAFHPLPGGRRAARERLFPGRSDLHDAFIVLNANRNQPRKRIDLTLEAFATFAQGKPENVKLYLHMARQDTGWDIRLLAERLGIADRLLVTVDDNNLPDLPTERLNLLYNACDVGVNTSYAEGWGLACFEHAATGAPQIIPRHTAMPELWEGAADLVAPRFTLTVERALITAHFVTPADIALSLQQLYGDPAYRQRMGEAALARVRAPRFDWDEIAGQWHALFAALLRGTAGAQPLRRIA